jgi:hypothetical protein
MKFDDKRYFCRHAGCISDPDDKTCGEWKPQDESYSPKDTIFDYMTEEGAEKYIKRMADKVKKLRKEAANEEEDH